ncbi:MAG: hypothetical protein R2788_17430 [Saprospiraceae bacterium]
MIEETLCTGGSIIVNGTVYDESNPDGVEVIPNGSVTLVATRPLRWN